ncbi:6428_t:CDS:2, partial [Funneliformis mosseae]
MLPEFMAVQIQLTSNLIFSASSPAPQPDPQKSQTMEMDSMLAEIDA